MRLERDGGDVVVLAVPLDPAAFPQCAQRWNHLVEPLAAVGEVLTLQVELLLHPTGAGAEGDPTAGEHRSSGHVLGDLKDRTVTGDVDVRRELQALGDARHRADHHPRIGPRRLWIPDRPAIRVW